MRQALEVAIIQKIRSLAAAGRYSYTRHARFDRMILRQVRHADIESCLSTAYRLLTWREGSEGDQTYKVEGLGADGGRLQAVVAVTEHEDGEWLVVVTVNRA